MEATEGQQMRSGASINRIVGWTTEALGGAAGAVLAIIGLSHVEPTYLVAVAGIALGASLVFQSNLRTAEYARVLRAAGREGVAGSGFGGGLSAQSMGGAAAVNLSLLALLGLPNTVLMGVVAIVLGAGLILNSGVNARLQGLKIEVANVEDIAKQVAQDAVSASKGAGVLVGIAAVALGILALIGIASTTLNLTAILLVGAAILLSASAVGLGWGFLPFARSL